MRDCDVPYLASPSHPLRVLAAIRSAAVLGIEAFAVTVEVDAAPGLPGWTMVGLPSGSVKEARERVGAALVNSGFALPPRRWTVNLSPADVRKDGTAFDLPVAIGVLVASGQLDAAAVEGLTFAGELGLDGTIRPIRGALPLARAARETGARALVLPGANAMEASLLRDVRLAPCESLGALVHALRAGTLPQASQVQPEEVPDQSADLSEVVGQPIAKRALEIAAAGGHNVYLWWLSRPLHICRNRRCRRSLASLLTLALSRSHSASSRRSRSSSSASAASSSGLLPS